MLNRRFFETTRGQIVTLLRRGTRTVEDLATALELSDNAVRNHLSTLERDLIIQQAGVRRTSGAGKPAIIYELHPNAEIMLSRAYAPVLTTVLETLVSSLPPAKADQLLREAGRRLAKEAGGRASGTIEARAQAAAALLVALGGDAEVTGPKGSLRIRGSGCPLSAAVSKRPELCLAVETLISEVSGTTAVSCCEHGDRPRCCFAIAGRR